MKKSKESSTQIGSIKYLTWVEYGFRGEYKLFDDLNDALDEMCYNELYIAHKVDEESIKKWQAIRKLKALN